MSDLDTKAIEARLAKAVRGPWDIATATDGSGDTGITAQIEDKTCVIAEVFSQVSGRGKDSWRCIHTAKFIAHAPADIAALLAEVEALRARLTIDDAMVGGRQTHSRMQTGRFTTG